MNIKQELKEHLNYAWSNGEIEQLRERVQTLQDTVSCLADFIARKLRLTDEEINDMLDF